MDELILTHVRLKGELLAQKVSYFCGGEVLVGELPHCDVFNRVAGEPYSFEHGTDALSY